MSNIIGLLVLFFFVAMIGVSIYLIVMEGRAKYGFTLLLLTVVGMFVAVILSGSKEEAEHAKDLTDCKVIGNAKDGVHGGGVKWRKIYRCDGEPDTIYIR